MNQSEALDLVGSKLDLAEACLKQQDFAGASKLYEECLDLMKKILTKDLEEIREY